MNIKMLKQMKLELDKITNELKEHLDMYFIWNVNFGEI